MIYRLDRAGGRLFDPTGRVWSATSGLWMPAEDALVGQPVDAAAAALWRQRDSGRPCRVPVAVIGGREARPDQLAAAEALGERLGLMGATLLCGGRQGVMEATCRGVRRGGGLSIGLLPDGEPEAANPFVDVPIATGIGVARNAIIARAALCLVAVGGGYGTISEIGYGLQFGKRVFGLADPPAIVGVERLPDAAAAAAAVAAVLLAAG